MPKHLYLLRHAESVDQQSRQYDKERELTPTGVKESMQIGDYLSRENFTIDTIISSSAARAQATAQIVSETLKFDTDKIIIDEELYDASVRTFLEYITRLDDHYNHVMCVGHNPVISYLAEYLTKAEIGDIATGGLVIIKFNVTSWRMVSQGNGELGSYTYPSMLN